VTETLRLLLLNENLGGHVTVHLGLAKALRDHPEIEPEFLDVPAPALVRRLAAAPVLGLARLDLDLQPLRSQLAAALVARRLLRERIGHVDALHVYTQNAGLLSASLLGDVPTVVSVDSTNVRNAYLLPQRYPTRFTKTTLPLSKWFEFRVFRAARIIVASSRWIRTSLLDDYGVPAAKIRVVPFGITVPRSLPRPERRGMPRITFVGRALQRKGGLRLLELHQRYLRDRCLLTLVTPEHVERGLTNVEVRDDIISGDGKLESVLAATDVFVFPSTMDQSPNAVLEAMAHGLPVIALPVAGVPEMVEDGTSGLLVPEDDDSALVSAISRLLDEPQVARAMGTRGRELVLERFDMRVTTRNLLDVVREAMALDSAGRRAPT
jgi:alpha-maltose-1-phosphate synthase